MTEAPPFALFSLTERVTQALLDAAEAYDSSDDLDEAIAVLTKVLDD